MNVRRSSQLALLKDALVTTRPTRVPPAKKPVVYPGFCPSAPGKRVFCSTRELCSAPHQSGQHTCKLPSRLVFGRSLSSSYVGSGYEGLCCYQNKSQTQVPPGTTQTTVAIGESTEFSPVSTTEPSEYFGGLIDGSHPLELSRQPVPAPADDVEVVEYNPVHLPPGSVTAVPVPGSFVRANLADFGLDCGRRDNDYKMIRVGRILGGDTAGFGDWPWMVMVLNYGRPRCGKSHDYINNEKTEYMMNLSDLGGTLISRNTVITAAHCVSGNLLLYNLTVKIGMFNMNERVTLPFPPVLVDVERIYRHPLFDFTTLLNDVAILHLKDSVTFAPNILPACLPSREYTPTTLTTVLGWGKEAENNTVYDLPDTLQSVKIPLISRLTCAQYFASQGLKNLIGTQHLCASTETGGRDACQGDSGGPMMYENPDGRYELIGIVSWGFGCGEPNIPGVYTNVFHYKSWILDTVRSLAFVEENKALN